MKHGEWLAIGQTFDRVGGQVLCAFDVAEEGFSGWYYTRALNREPAPVLLSELLEFLDALFAEHGAPRRGIVLSKSVWQSSQEMLFDDETGERGAALEETEVAFGPMSEQHKKAIPAELRAKYGIQTVNRVEDIPG